MTAVATERLVLRPFTPDDAEAFAAINADPLVTRFVGGPLSREASDAFLARTMAYWDEHGHGRFAVEDDGVLLGYCGLGAHPLGLGEIEIGWRLASAAWGRGLATEAALAVRDLALGPWGLSRLVAVMHPDNTASLRVATKIGMTHWRDVPHDGQTLVVYVTPAAAPLPGSSTGAAVRARPRHPRATTRRS